MLICNKILTCVGLEQNILCLFFCRVQIAVNHELSFHLILDSHEYRTIPIELNIGALQLSNRKQLTQLMSRYSQKLF